MGKTDFTWKVVGDRVIEFTYNDFDYEAGIDAMKKHDPVDVGGRCSAVRVRVNDKVYVGRNLDFYCTNSPAYIIKNNSGKYRTIGIGSSPVSMPDWCENYEIPEQVGTFAPFICTDVMSEAGIYAETNIRPEEDCFVVTETNPGKRRVYTSCLMQLMLSQYGTLEEILAHIDDYDWFGLSKMGFEQTFFMTDKDGRSIIIEFANNSWRWQDAEYNANFFINDEWYSMATKGCGEMRVSRELAYKPFVRNEEDVFTMMEQGRYGRFYEPDCPPEYAYPEFFELTGYNNKTAKEDWDGCMAATQREIDKVSKYTWEDKVREKSWETTFIVAANVSDMYLNVHFSEHYKLQFKVEF